MEATDLIHLAGSDEIEFWDSENIKKYLEDDQSSLRGHHLITKKTRGYTVEAPSSHKLKLTPP
jgi:hypothetical protein